MAVIHEVREEDIMLVKGPTGALERKPFDTRHQTSERDWYVADDSGSPIKVVRGREADPAELSNVMERAEHYQDRRETNQSTMQTTEKFLPVGAIITVVGELARNSISSGMLPHLSYLVRPPAWPGGPFFISNKTITELHMSLARRAGAMKAARQAWLRYREHQARERVRKALEHGLNLDTAAAAGTEAGAGGEAAAGGSGSGRAAGADAGRDAGVCVVCLSAPSEMVYVRCGHMCCCVRCSQAMSAKRCPVCRCEGQVIKVFRT
eukprot:gene1456-1798_t